MEREPGRNRIRALLVPSVFYVAAGLYLLALTIGSVAELWILVCLSVASIVAGAGLFMLKRWGFWLAVWVFPLLFVVAASTLTLSAGLPAEDSGLSELLFEASMAGVAALSLLSVIILVEKRSSFRMSVSQPP
ncbi:MAG: hypothetical protein QW828_03980, partial [Candidatus Bathyarchaeia archaeon]